MLLVGVGEAIDRPTSAAPARPLARATKDRASVVTSLAAIAPDEGLGAFVVGAMLALVRLPLALRPGRRSDRSPGSCWPASTTTAPTTSSPGRSRSVVPAGARAPLATVPANLKTPAWLAEQAVEVGEAAGLEVHGLGRGAAAQAEGFGGMLAVGGGSVHRPA